MQRKAAILRLKKSANRFLKFHSSNLSRFSRFWEAVLQWNGRVLQLAEAEQGVFDRPDELPALVPHTADSALSAAQKLEALLAQNLDQLFLRRGLPPVNEKAAAGRNSDDASPLPAQPTPLAPPKGPKLRGGRSKADKRPPRGKKGMGGAERDERATAPPVTAAPRATAPLGPAPAAATPAASDFEELNRRNVAQALEKFREASRLLLAALEAKRAVQRRSRAHTIAATSGPSLVGPEAPSSVRSRGEPLRPQAYETPLEPLRAAARSMIELDDRGPLGRRTEPLRLALKDAAEFARLRSPEPAESRPSTQQAARSSRSLSQSVRGSEAVERPEEESEEEELLIDATRPASESAMHHSLFAIPPPQDPRPSAYTSRFSLDQFTASVQTAPAVLHTVPLRFDQDGTEANEGADRPEDDDEQSAATESPGDAERPVESRRPTFQQRPRQPTARSLGSEIADSLRVAGSRRPAPQFALTEPAAEEYRSLLSERRAEFVDRNAIAAGRLLHQRILDLSRQSALPPALAPASLLDADQSADLLLLPAASLESSLTEADMLPAPHAARVDLEFSESREHIDQRIGLSAPFGGLPADPSALQYSHQSLDDGLRGRWPYDESIASSRPTTVRGPAVPKSLGPRRALPSRR
jgi:hypothetical protein